MKTIKETQVLSTVHLSDTQKVVMAKIMAAPTPQVANEEISTGTNTVAAKEALVELGLIEVSETDVNVTETGQKVMKDENLSDDSGQLTDEGQKYAAVREPRDLKDIDATKDAPAPQVDPAAPADPNAATPANVGDELAMESLSLLRSIDRQVLEDKILELISTQTST